MPSVNPVLRLPGLPPWLDLERCEGCGDLYRDHRSGATFSDAHQRIRSAALRDGDEGGGYRSRGPVLWAMRVLKAESWMMRHLNCRPEVKELPDESEYWQNQLNKVVDEVD